jgi:hypothetical protein
LLLFGAAFDIDKILSGNGCYQASGAREMKMDMHTQRAGLAAALGLHQLASRSQKRSRLGLKKCSKKVQETVDSHLDICNINATHGKHITTK